MPKRLQGARALQKQYDTDPDHSNQVRKLAKMIFTALQELPECSDQRSIYLEAGALLHDIGQFVQLKDHHLISRDIILREGIQGFGKKELQAVACITRYHRKNGPQKKDPEYGSLPKRWRRVVDVGSAIVRIADGLDRSHKGCVEKVKVKIKKEGIIFKLISDSQVSTEIWGALRKKSLFEEVFGVKCRFESNQDNIFHA